ncbi:hypothetical protein [Methanobacterium congolense]|uniref:hypothetical protein n=1 Tax=Methanobacterium congolense TaxID=118062 RepID=UPI0009034FD5|nr:hypothetical protein [Methanobacterium congolense]
MLFIGWSVLEGVGAALMIPASTSIVTGSYEGERRVFALGITSSMAMISTVTYLLSIRTLFSIYNFRFP